MPGRNPYQAYTEFVEPIAQALACVTHEQVIVSNGGKQKTDKDHYLTVGGPEGNGVQLGDFTLSLALHYRIVKVEGQRRPFKVSTTSYQHELYRGDTPLFAMHWHPDGNSPYKLTHVHLNLADMPRDRFDQHLPTSRLSIEDAIEWAIGLGVTPRRADWDSVVKASRERHMTYASWTDRGPLLA